MATLADCQQALQDRITLLRALYKLVTSLEFQEIYEQVSEKEQLKLMQAIVAGNKNFVQSWIEKERDIGSMSVRQLRKIACELCVENYSYLTKSLLLSEIKNARSNSTNRTSP